MACRKSTWNVSSMVHRSGEEVEALHRINMYFCCAQETRWKGGSMRMLFVENTSSFGKVII